MRYLKPQATHLKIGEKIYDILFTLEVIDQLQDKSAMSINELLSLTTHKRFKKDAVKCILKYITGEIIEIPDEELDYYSIFLLNTYIEQLKYKEMPKPTPSESSEEHPYIDVEYWYYFGTVILQQQEDKVWNMTLGQLRTLQQEHYKHIGAIKEDKVFNIDDVI